MNPVIHFKATCFDIAREPENPINPIPGSSLLNWLRQHFPSMPSPEPEDWGWYSEIKLDGRAYLIGSCAHEATDGNHEWGLQIDKLRSLKEKLLGQAKMGQNDPCFIRIRHLIQNEPQFTDLTFEGGP